MNTPSTSDALPQSGRPLGTLWWVLATPVVQVATAMVLGITLMLIVAAFDGGWGIFLAALAGMLVGPSVVLGVIVGLARRNAKARRPVLAGVVVGLISGAVLAVLLTLVDVIAFPVFLVASMGVVAWATPGGRGTRESPAVTRRSGTGGG
jgi:ABC-type cobalamin transport system permease subunit